MILLKWEKSDREGPGFMLKMTPEEALLLIKSLSSQMAADNANTGREEFRTENNEYFSAVVQKKIQTLEEKELELDYIYAKIKQHASYEASEWPLNEEKLPYY